MYVIRRFDYNFEIPVKFSLSYAKHAEKKNEISRRKRNKMCSIQAYLFLYLNAKKYDPARQRVYKSLSQ